jgi:hypothetical protein
MRVHASSSGMRQSAPTTSPPASRMSARMFAVPVPKWMVGTRRPTVSKMRCVWGSANSR